MVEPANGVDAEVPPSGPPVPVAGSIVRLHMAIMTVAAFAYCFLCYCILRALLADFGVSFATIAKATIATAAMGGFIVWLVPLAELPEIVLGHALPQRRSARGRCPACGYDLQGRRGVRCSECGHDGSVPGTWHLSWGTARRFLMLLLAGLALGVIVGEAWTTADERSFAGEAESLQRRIDTSLDARGPFDERLLVLAGGVAEAPPDIPSSGFAWMARAGGRPEPADRIRSESAILGAGIALSGGGAREQIESLHHRWTWSVEPGASNLLFHIDLRHLPARGRFVLSMGSHLVDGEVVRADRLPDSATEQGATAVALAEVLVRRADPAADDSVEVEVHRLDAELQRPRRWPAAFASMRWTPERGIEVIAPFHSPRVVASPPPPQMKFRSTSATRR